MRSASSMFGWNSRSGWGRIFSSRSFQSPTARPASVTVTRKVTADGYTWGYGTASSGETGWIVVDNGWTILAD